MCAQPAIFFQKESWTKLNKAEQNWTKLNKTEQNWTKLNKIEQNLNKTWVVLELQYYQ